MKYLLICFTFCSRLFRTSHHKLPSLPGLLISMVFNMQPMKHDGKGRPLLIIVKSVRRDHLPNSFKRKTKRETQERERDEKGVLSTLRYRDNSNSSVTQTRSYYLVSITITTTESLPPSGGWNEEEDSESTSVWNVRVEFHRQFEAKENVSVRALLVNIVREQKPREKKQQQQHELATVDIKHRLPSVDKSKNKKDDQIPYRQPWLYSQLLCVYFDLKKNK